MVIWMQEKVQKENKEAVTQEKLIQQNKETVISFLIIILKGDGDLDVIVIHESSSGDKIESTFC